MILGASPSATADEIKSEYRRLAKEFHPDHYTGGNKTFREIQEAYSVLGNARRRQEYEQQISKKPINVAVKRPTHHPEPEPLIPEPRPIDVGDISPVRLFQTFWSYKGSRCNGSLRSIRYTQHSHESAIPAHRRR